MLRLLFNLYQLLTWPLWALLRRARRGPRWVELSLQGSVDELVPSAPSGLRGLLARLRPAPVSVAELRALGDRLVSDRQVQGLLVNLGSLRSGWTTLVSLRTALHSIVARGKRVVVLLPEGGGQEELFVAAAASEIVAPLCASFSLLGPLASRRYVAPLLSKVGLQVEVIAQGRYKTAAEALVREDMSPAEREQSGALIATLKDTLSEALSQRLDGNTEQMFERALFSAEEAQNQRLIDRTAYRDELEASLGLDDKQRPREQRAYMKASRPRRLLPLRRPARVAILQLTGPIGDVSSARSIARKPTTAALRALAERPDVLGVVMYLDSPGGSAIVSDLLHHEVQRLAKQKPVVAWMGNVAASGGYYLAAAAQRIVAHDCTITGSIGVISAHLVAAELLSRIGIRSEVVKHTPYADLANMARPLDATERMLLDAQSRNFYTRFLEVVAQGRRFSVERAAELAEGRVWSGRDAQREGLVDVLGGYAEALSELRGLLGADGARVAWDAPLVLRPQGEPGGLWGRVSQLAALLGDETRIHPEIELAELSLRQGPLLAYALGALSVLP